MSTRFVDPVRVWLIAMLLNVIIIQRFSNKYNEIWKYRFRLTKFSCDQIIVYRKTLATKHRSKTVRIFFVKLFAQ